MNAADPYTAMLNQVAKDFPNLPIYTDALRRIQHPPAADEDILCIHNLFKIYHNGFNPVHLFRPLTGRIVESIDTTKKSEQHISFLKSLISCADGAVDEIRPHHIPILYSLIAEQMTEEDESAQGKLLNMLWPIVVADQGKALTTQLISLGIFKKMSAILRSDRSRKIKMRASELSAQLLLGTPENVRKEAYKADLLQAILSNTEINPELASILSFYPDEIDSDSKKAMIQKMKDDNHTYEAHELIVDYHFSDTFDLKNYQSELIKFEELICRNLDLIDKFYKKIANPFTINIQKSLSLHLRVFKDLTLKYPPLNFIHLAHFKQTLLQPIRGLTLQHRVHIACILHQFTKMPKGNGNKVDPKAFFNNVGLYNIYKNIYQPIHTFQLINRERDQPMPPAIVNLIGIYSLIIMEKIND